jgi:hypothetical protein
MGDESRPYQAFPLLLRRVCPMSVESHERLVQQPFMMIQLGVLAALMEATLSKSVQYILDISLLI